MAGKKVFTLEKLRKRSSPYERVAGPWALPSGKDRSFKYLFTDFPGFPIDNPGRGIYNICGNYRAQRKIGPVESGTGGFRN